METHLVVNACIVRDGKVLLQMHAKLKKWLFPGGHIEKNETPDAALVREVKEETGLDFRFSDYGVFGKEKIGDEIERLAVPVYVNTHNVGDHIHCGLCYLGTVDKAEFTINDESLDLRWFDASEVKALDNIPDSIRRIALYSLEKVNG